MDVQAKGPLTAIVRAPRGQVGSTSGLIFRPCLLHCLGETSLRLSSFLETRETLIHPPVALLLSLLQIDYFDESLAIGTALEVFLD